MGVRPVHRYTDTRSELFIGTSGGVVCMRGVQSVHWKTGKGFRLFIWRPRRGRCMGIRLNRRYVETGSDLFVGVTSGKRSYEGRVGS